MLHQVRVSATPFNRVWPGYQRDPKQSESAWFVEFEQSAPVMLDVEFAEEPPATLEVRPFSLGIVPERTSPRTASQSPPSSRSRHRMAIMRCMSSRTSRCTTLYSRMTSISGQANTTQESSCPRQDRRLSSTLGPWFTG